jgi:hypothetical protein
MPESHLKFSVAFEVFAGSMLNPAELLGLFTQQPSQQEFTEKVMITIPASL